MRNILFLIIIPFAFLTMVGLKYHGEITENGGKAAAGMILREKIASDSKTVLLSSLEMGEALCADRPQSNKSIGGRQMRIGGQKFETGLGTNARTVLWIKLQGGAQKFSSFVGIDDEVVPVIVGNELRSAFVKGYDEYRKINGQVVFLIYGDGKLLWKSEVMRTGMPAQKVEVNLTGVNMLVLVAASVTDAVSFDHANWAEAKFEITGAAPVVVAPPREEKYILTPEPAHQPSINGARVFGVKPGSPFLFTVAVSGDRPMTFKARNLPAGLKLDENTGHITGILKNKGEWKVGLTASNALGKSEKILKIVCGNTLALTPPMGWNSWNVFSRSVNEWHIRSAADVMVSSGLINHGWNYINIDDCWQIKHSAKDSMLVGAPRDENGMINTNKKFPDMKALCDYIHSKGLKAGIYSSPGLYTCQGHTGSYGYEQKDAKRYADWGFDYLKYDWCYAQYSSKDVSLDVQRQRWLIMDSALRNTKRDIVYSLSETLDVWPWAKETGANAWRTTGDITDTWASVDGIGFTQDGREIVAGPGHWNDCDMFVVGMLGGGKSPSRLTPDEQYTHVSLWSLLASPLLIGCDLTKLDEFTLGLLTNDELIEVNQDPLGKQAHRISKDENVEIWAKKMEDGTYAVGLFNRGEFENPVKVLWSSLGLQGKQHVRNLWRQKDVGEFSDSFTAAIPRHGAMVIRVRPGKMQK